MPRVSIRYYGFIRQPAGNKSREDIEVPNNTTLREMINMLADRYGNRFRDHLINEDGSIMGGPVLISVNGSPVDHLDVPLIGDSNVEIAVIAMIAGGYCDDMRRFVGTESEAGPSRSLEELLQGARKGLSMNCCSSPAHRRTAQMPLDV